MSRGVRVCSRRGQIDAACEIGRAAPVEGERVAHLEKWGPDGHDVVPLDRDRLSVGKSPDCDVAMSSDTAVSRVHLLLEHVSGSWCVTDLGSRNGTFVNGERLFGPKTLRDRDELTIGHSRLVFSDRSPHEPSTDAVDPPPQLTSRERDVLVELCRPLLQGDVFVQPASVHEIAQRLFVVDAAVKQHLSRLYDKFRIHDEAGTTRRVRLANAAVQTGSVTMADLRKGKGT